MGKILKYLFAVFMGVLLMTGNVFASEQMIFENETDSKNSGTEIGVEAPYVVLMEVSTGEVLYEKDFHTAVPPASVTKNHDNAADF